MANPPPPTRRIEKNQSDVRLMQVRELIGGIIAELKKLAARPQDQAAIDEAAKLNRTLASLRNELFAAMSSTDKLK